MRVEDLFEGFHQVLEQGKPIGDLGGLWCAVARPVGIGFGPIARQDLHPRVGLKPLRQGCPLPVGQQGHRLPALQIDQDRAIGLAFPQGEIVDTEHPGAWRTTGQGACGAGAAACSGSPRGPTGGSGAPQPCPPGPRRGRPGAGPAAA